MQTTKDCTVKTVQKTADLAVHAGSHLYTGSHKDSCKNGHNLRECGNCAMFRL
jgi:hypothetical protein